MTNITDISHSLVKILSLKIFMYQTLERACHHASGCKQIYILHGLVKIYSMYNQMDLVFLSPMYQLKNLRLNTIQFDMTWRNSTLMSSHQTVL